MNREIKFRAWDNYSKSFINDDEYLIGLDGKFYRMDFYSGIENYEDGNLIWNELDNITLSQFTGLLDKNGKEIFEGDIIKIKCNEDIIIGHVFYKQSRCCYMINHPAGYNGSFALHTPTIAICDEFNIIGNIYQNPELLGGQDE